MSRARSARRFGGRRVAVLVAGLTILSVPAFAGQSRAHTPAADADHLSRTLPLAPNTPIRIAITEGSVIVTGESRSDLAVDIVRRAAGGKSTTALPMVVEQTADGIHISALQASDTAHLGHDPDLQATVTVHVPVDADIAAVDVFEGRIELTNLRGNVTAEITRGPIQATRLTGRVRLTGHIGDVTVEQAELPADGLLRLRTFNGTVRLALATRPANARVLAVTFNGHVSSNLPLEMKDQFGPNFGETTIGSGEPLISIDVVTGDIRITAPAS
jgi:hypothetical protein